MFTAPSITLACVWPIVEPSRSLVFVVVPTDGGNQFALEGRQSREGRQGQEGARRREDESAGRPRGAPPASGSRRAADAHYSAQSLV